MITFDLIPPHMDKGWAFTVSAIPPEQIPSELRESLLILMGTPIAKRANPFLQSDCLGWIMIEFWIDDENTIANVAAFFESNLR